jgi:hypothetical protein
MAISLLPDALTASKSVSRMAGIVWGVVRAAEARGEILGANEVAHRVGTECRHVTLLYRDLVAAGLVELRKEGRRVVARALWPAWLGDEATFLRAVTAVAQIERAAAAPVRPPRRRRAA